MLWTYFNLGYLSFPRLFTATQTANVKIILDNIISLPWLLMAFAAAFSPAKGQGSTRKIPFATISGRGLLPTTCANAPAATGKLVAPVSRFEHFTARTHLLDTSTEAAKAGVAVTHFLPESGNIHIGCASVVRVEVAAQPCPGNRGPLYRAILSAALESSIE